MEKGTNNISVYINENTQEMNVRNSYEIPHSELYLKISVQHLLLIDNWNWEGLHEPGGQLAGSYLEGQIPGGGPDPPPRTVDRSRNSSLIGPSRRPTSRQGDSGG